MKKYYFSDELKAKIIQDLETKAAWEVLDELNASGMMITESGFKSWRDRNGIETKVRKSRQRGKSQIFTPEMQSFILEHLEDWCKNEMAEKINKKFGTDIKPSQVRAWKHNHHHYSQTLTGGYTENRPNPYKGCKGWSVPNSEKTRYKPGHENEWKEPVGTIKIRCSGKTGKNPFHVIKIADPSEWKLYSRYVWEQANGPIPEGMIVKHLDGDSLNDNLENLFLTTYQEHGTCVITKKYSSDPEISKCALLTARLSHAIKGRENE